MSESKAIPTRDSVQQSLNLIAEMRNPSRICGASVSESTVPNYDMRGLYRSQLFRYRDLIRHYNVSFAGRPIIKDRYDIIIAIQRYINNIYTFEDFKSIVLPIAERTTNTLAVADAAAAMIIFKPERTDDIHQLLSRCGFEN